jgi:molecular chaperone DnaK
VPSIGGTFHSGRNYYSRQAGEIDYSSASKLVRDQANSVRTRVEAVSNKVDNPKLDQAMRKLDSAAGLEKDSSDPETTKQAMDDVLEARRLLAQVRKQHLKEIRQMDLDSCSAVFEERVREFARPSESSSFDNLVRTAQRSIDVNGADFENQLEQLKGKNFDILWRQDWFVVNRFKWLAGDEYLFPDKRAHAKLVKHGEEAIEADDIDKLREVVFEMDCVRIRTDSDDKMLSSANIVRG